MHRRKTIRIGGAGVTGVAAPVAHPVDVVAHLQQANGFAVGNQDDVHLQAQLRLTQTITDNATAAP